MKIGDITQRVAQIKSRNSKDGHGDVSNLNNCARYRQTEHPSWGCSQGALYGGTMCPVVVL